MTNPDPLKTFVGDFPTVNPNARRVASLVDNPGCLRRSVLDVSGIDYNKLAVAISGENPDRQSPFAIARGNQFESYLARDDMALIIKIVRDFLHFEIRESRQVDLSPSVIREQYPHISSREEMNLMRAKLTQKLLGDLINNSDSSINLIRHGVTTLKFGGQTVFLEQDVMAFSFGSRLYVVEIKSFPKVDGKTDADKASQAIRQCAVYILSLQEAVASLGGSPSIIDNRVLIIQPKNLSFKPTATLSDVRFQVERLKRQLLSVTDTQSALAQLAPSVNLPAFNKDSNLEAVQAQTIEALSQLPMRFCDSCISCPLFRRCRSEAYHEGLTSRLGNLVANTCGSIATTDMVLSLVNGYRLPQNASEHAVKESLSRAANAQEFAMRIAK